MDSADGCSCEESAVPDDRGVETSLPFSEERVAASFGLLSEAPWTGVEGFDCGGSAEIAGLSSEARESSVEPAATGEADVGVDTCDRAADEALAGAMDLPAPLL
jgi:hypothetical protein